MDIRMQSISDSSLNVIINPNAHTTSVCHYCQTFSLSFGVHLILKTFSLLHLSSLTPPPPPVAVLFSTTAAKPCFPLPLMPGFLFFPKLLHLHLCYIIPLLHARLSNLCKKQCWVAVDLLIQTFFLCGFDCWNILCFHVVLLINFPEKLFCVLKLVSFINSNDWKTWVKLKSI